MTDNGIDIIFVIDRSTTDKGVLAAIKENMREIVSELNSRINRVSLICFSNSPTVVYEFITADSLDVSSLELEGGGMCNVHFALKETCRLIGSSMEDLVCLLMFLTSDPTDSIKLLDEGCRKILDETSKYLVKRTSTLLEPIGFNGNRSYTLGSEQDLKRLIQDIEDSDRIADPYETNPLSREPDNDEEHILNLEDAAEENIDSNPSEESVKVSNDSKINPPEIEQDIYS
ncbi:MAG: VWA domain-containing protein [Bacteroides sp.]|nr:VWA domain-containing protein [Bacteroides sp.]